MMAEQMPNISLVSVSTDVNDSSIESKRCSDWSTK